MRRLLFLALTALAPALPATSQIQTDCDADGISDITFTATSGSEFAWSCLGSTSGNDDIATTFGLTTDSPAPAKWLDPELMSLAVIRQSGQGLLWKLLEGEGSVLQKKFGKAGDNTLSGADFNGDGISDAAVVRFEGSKIRWQIKPNLFSNPRPVLSFVLGSSGDRVFYLNPNGLRDCAAAFGEGSGSRPRLTFRDTKTKKVRSFTRFPAALGVEPRPRPFPVNNAEGTDNVGFISEDDSDTTIRVFTVRGRKVGRHTFPGKGAFAVGDFDPDLEGEEIALQTTSSLYIYNPSSGDVVTDTAPSGTILDEINVSVVGAIEASPTPTATPEEGQ